MRPFYRGETIDLLVPTREHVEHSTWADWFNSQKTNQFTNHALFPNTVEDQGAFFDALSSRDRLALLIAPSGGSEPIGTISLSGIDFRRGLATIAIVMDTESEVPKSTYASLEAMSIVTQHAFEVLGLSRVQAGQVYPALARWNQLLEILGYRSEGIRRSAFARGHAVSDEVTLAVLYPRFLKLVAERGGSLWPGTQEVPSLVRALPKKSFAEILDEAQRTLEVEYFGED